MKKLLLSLATFCGITGGTVYGQYCTPVTSSGCGFGDQIENFSTTNGITNISNLASGCSALNYAYVTGQALTVTAGNSFDITIQAGSSFSQGHAIWIDWNNDLDFTDPGEAVFTSSTWATTPFSVKTMM